MTQKAIDALAKEFVELELQRKTLENRVSEIKSLLRKECPNGKDFLFEDIGMKLAVNAPVMETGIQSEKLVEDFLKQNRIDDLIKIVTVTKTAVTKNLEDSSELIARYSVEVGLKEGVVKLSPFSKKDLKSLQD